MSQKKKKITSSLKTKNQLSRLGPRKKKKGNWTKIMCTCIWTFLSIKKKCIPTHFSLHFGEKTFWWV